MYLIISLSNNISFTSHFDAVRVPFLLLILLHTQQTQPSVLHWQLGSHPHSCFCTDLNAVLGGCGEALSQIINAKA